MSYSFIRLPIYQLIQVLLITVKHTNNLPTTIITQLRFTSKHQQKNIRKTQTEATEVKIQTSNALIRERFSRPEMLVIIAKLTPLLLMHDLLARREEHLIPFFANIIDRKANYIC